VVDTVFNVVVVDDGRLRGRRSVESGVGGFVLEECDKVMLSRFLSEYHFDFSVPGDFVVDGSRRE
jgi:hypothetical protein